MSENEFLIRKSVCIFIAILCCTRILYVDYQTRKYIRDKKNISKKGDLIIPFPCSPSI